MANFLKNLFKGKDKANVQEIKSVDPIEIKPADESKSYSVKVYMVNVEKYNEGDTKVFETVKTIYNYGDMFLIYEKDNKKPVALYQYKINGWERI